MEKSPYVSSLLETIEACVKHHSTLFESTILINLLNLLKTLSHNELIIISRIILRKKIWLRSESFSNYFKYNTDQSEQLLDLTQILLNLHKHGLIDIIYNSGISKDKVTDTKSLDIDTIWQCMVDCLSINEWKEIHKLLKLDKPNKK